MDAKEKRGAATAAKWAAARKAAQENLLWDVDIGDYVRYFDSLCMIAADHQPKVPSLPGVTGLWIHGETGVGKTVWARTRYPEAYIKSGNKWWDGYMGQEVVVLDDMDRQHVVLGSHLKQWTGGNPFPAEVKGGSMCIRPRLFIVTSNYAPEDIWTHARDARVLAAVRSRCTVVHFQTSGTAVTDQEALFAHAEDIRTRVSPVWGDSTWRCR